VVAPVQVDVVPVDVMQVDVAREVRAATRSLPVRVVRRVRARVRRASTNVVSVESRSRVARRCASC
jgi:threonyl-tRNA synthetase